VEESMVVRMVLWWGGGGKGRGEGRGKGKGKGNGKGKGTGRERGGLVKVSKVIYLPPI
jgi:hypothetical protein